VGNQRKIAEKSGITKKVIWKKEDEVK